MTNYVVNPGQTSSGIALNAGDTATVFSGGTVVDTAVNSSGLLTVSSGGRANDTTISGGQMLVVSGGAAGATIIDFAGSALVSGGTATNTTLFGGFLGVLSGGVAGGTTVIHSAFVAVSSGGTIYNPSIDTSQLVLASGAVVSGGISFLGLGEVDISGTVMPGNTIFDFSPGGYIVLSDIPFGDAKAILTVGNVLHIVERSGAAFDLQFDPNQSFAGERFSAQGDGFRTSVTVINGVVQSPAVLNEFSWQQGWGNPANPRVVSDLNGDSASDYLGFGKADVRISYGGTPFSTQAQPLGPGFLGTVVSIHDFGTVEGYTADMQRGAAATGAGVGDSIYGQGFAGIYWYSATGSSPSSDASGAVRQILQYQSSPNFYGNFGAQQGWTADNGFQIVKTSASDGYTSILGFGNDGIMVGPQAFAPGATAAGAYLIPLAVGNNSGWSQQNDIRSFTDNNNTPLDLNHDGNTDFVGMGPQGLVFAYGGTATGSYQLGPLQTAQVNGTGADLGEAQGWTKATTERVIIADPQSGFDNIVAFGNTGTFVAMGQDPAMHNGQPFAQLYLAMPDFGADQEWSATANPRLVGDVNGDGIPDIVGFGINATYAAIGSRDTAGNLHFTIDPTQTIYDFGSADGWSGANPDTVRALGSVVGTNALALIVSGASNTSTWQFS